MSLNAVQAKAVTHPKNVRLQLWGVSLMAFLWTMSSFMVFSILPMFLTDELGANLRQVGNLEGIASFTAFFMKFFSGIVSDIFRSRIGILAMGTALTSAAKLLFACATGIGGVFMARFIDRLSKGIRAAPADAIIADLSSQPMRGQSYGLRQSLMSLGAVCGAVIASSMLAHTSNNYRLIFACATLPAALSLVVLFTMVRTPSPNSALVNKSQSKPFAFTSFFTMPTLYWVTLALLNILMFARFSESFVLYRARDIGWTKNWLPYIFGIINCVHAVCAYPAGILADRIGKIRMAIMGLIVLITANLIIIYANTPESMGIGIMLIGVEMAMTHSTLKATISDLLPAHARGTGFSLIALSTGLTLYASNALAGECAHSYGTFAPFVVGTFAASIAIIGFLILHRFQLKKGNLPSERIKG
ncbi:MAG: MFS transporter [Alphaproteobacteria bacterium]|nr:MAG: MFS transporter [Alphaproteobacteria bacterium]